MDLERLASVSFVGKLLGKSLHDVTQAVLESLVHLRKVSLLIKRILHFLHPLGEFVSQMIQSILEILHPLYKSIESLLADTTATCSLRDLEISKGIVK